MITTMSSEIDAADLVSLILDIAEHGVPIAILVETSRNDRRTVWHLRPFTQLSRSIWANACGDASGDLSSSKVDFRRRHRRS